MWIKENSNKKEMMVSNYRCRRCVCCLLCVIWCVLLFAGCGVPDRALVLTGEVPVNRDEANRENAVDNAIEGSDSLQADNRAERLAAGQAVAEPTIFVHVCGAVQCPGVVEIPDGSRVRDALEAAGGLLEEAATDYVNLAAKLEDAQQLYFPTKEEAEHLWQEDVAAAKGLVNINTASMEQLCTLPGIGEARAADIIAFREQNGAFQSKEAIMRVPGIKQNAYDKLAAYITVD